MYRSHHLLLPAHLLSCFSKTKDVLKLKMFMVVIHVVKIVFMLKMLELP